MQGLRSRAGIVAMTAGAIALLSVPVVALAKGPPDEVGGGNDTARSVASPQASIPDTNRGQAKKQAPVVEPAPAPKPTPPGHAKRAGKGSAPTGGSAGGGNGSVGGGNGSGPSLPAKKAGSHPAPPAHAKAYGHRTPPGHAKHSDEPAEGSADPGSVNEPEPSGSPDQPSRPGSPHKPSRPDSPDKLDPTGPLDLPSADSPESSDGGIPAAVVSDTVELPEDASPETLPFTGIQLGLLALIGLTSLVGGFALRRSAT